MIRAAPCFAALAWSAALLAAAIAQQAQKPPAPPAAIKEIERTDRQRELDALLGDLQRSREHEAKLKSEIDQIKNDRKKFSQVLAALERLGLRPAPALLLQSETTLEAVRSAILLGAVIPELRAEAETLAA